MSRTACKCCQVFQYPSADDAVIGENDNRNCAGEPSQRLEPFVDFRVRLHNALSGSSANGDFCNHQRESKGHRQNEIDQEEYASAVFCGEVGESPDISQPDSRTRCCQNKPQLRAEAVFLLLFCAFHTYILSFSVSSETANCIYYTIFYPECQSICALLFRHAVITEPHFLFCLHFFVLKFLRLCGILNMVPAENAGIFQIYSGGMNHEKKSRSKVLFISDAGFDHRFL